MGPEEAWRGQEPAEGTRRRLVRDAVLTFYVDAEGDVTHEQAERSRQVNAPLALELADRIEEALLAADQTPAAPPEAAGDGDPS